jgi:membrane-associated protein
MSPGWLFALVLIACALEATLLLGTLVPGEAVLVLAAGMVGLSQLPVVMGAAVLGTFLGQYVGYLLGVRYGGRIRFSRLGRRFGSQRWRRSELVVRGATAMTMVAVRFIAFGHTLAPVIAGMLHMEHRRFVRLTALASLVWSMVWMGIGLAAGAIGMSAENPVLAIGLATVGVIVATVALARLTRRVGREADAGAQAAGPTQPASGQDLLAA